MTHCSSAQQPPQWTSLIDLYVLMYKKLSLIVGMGEGEEQANKSLE